MDSVFIAYFFSTLSMTLIQRELQNPDVGEAPRCLKHYFWSRRKIHIRDENLAHFKSKYFINFHIFREFLNFQHTEGVESSASKIFSTASKIMFKASWGFSNIRALQRILKQGHRMCIKKVRNKNWPVCKFHSQLTLTTVLTQTSLNDFFHFLKIYSNEHVKI